MVLIRFITLCLWPILVFAQAPLLSRHVNDAIDNHYIVVLKPNLGSSVATSYYNSLRTLSKALIGPHQGLLRTFESVDGLHAFHIECDKAVLETIRKNPKVSTHLRIPSGATALLQANVSIDRLLTSLKMARLPCKRPSGNPYAGMMVAIRMLPPLRHGGLPGSPTARQGWLDTSKHRRRRLGCTFLTPVFN